MFGTQTSPFNQAPPYTPTTPSSYLSVTFSVGGLRHYEVVFDSGGDFSSFDDMGATPVGGDANPVIALWDLPGEYEWSGWNTSIGGAGVFAYSWDTNEPVNIPDPSTIFDVFTPSDIAVSPDGTRIAVSIGDTPWLRFYSNTAGTIAQITNPADMPTSAGFLSWSRDGRFCAFGSSGAQNLIIYDFNSGSPVKLADPASMPSGGVDDIAFSPAFDYLTMSHSGTGKIKTYSYSGTTFTALSDPGTVPGGNSNCVKWSNTALRFSVGSSTTPWIQHYEISGSNQNKLANSATLPGNSVIRGEIAYSPDDAFCAVSGSGTGVNLIVYETAGNTAVAFNSGDAPSTAGGKVSFSPRAYQDGYLLAASFASGNTIRLYDVQPTLVSLLAGGSLASVFSIAWRGE